MVFLNPLVTPSTMLLSKARVKPCSARVSRRSSGRVTLSSPPSCATLIDSTKVRFNSPLGPLTITSEPSILTCTPVGIETGFFPIRDITSSETRNSSGLPDVAQHFAAHAQALGLLTGDNAFRRRQDRDTHARQHARHIYLGGVYSATGFADALDAGDGRNAMASIAHIFQPQAQRGMGPTLLLSYFKILNVPFVLQDVCNGDL